MSLPTLIATLVIIGVLMWLVSSFGKRVMHADIVEILIGVGTIVAVLCLLAWLLGLFGIALGWNLPWLK